MGLDPASATQVTASLAPGFRFHPTDEELVSFYLKRKVCSKPFRFDAICEIDIYKSEPWDLPGKSRLKTRDLEWYFFSVLDKKYGNGSRTNRATEKGYWKTTGKDRPVHHKSRTVGMKKTLVYHCGRAPRGERTNWVMHEYRLVDEDLEKSGISQDAFVLCRIFQKSGSGPKNGEQYGAPFIEEEWEDDEMVMIPGEDVPEELAIADDAYLNGNDLQQIFNGDISAEDVPLPQSFYYGDDGSHAHEQVDIINDSQEFFMVTDGNISADIQHDDQKLFSLPAQNDRDAAPVKQEYIGEPSNTVNSGEVDYLLDLPFFDATGNGLFDDGAYLETNDLLSNTVEADSSGFDMLNPYNTLFDADDGNKQYMAFDSPEMTGRESLVSEQALREDISGGMQQENITSQQQQEGHGDDYASTSKHEPGDLEPNKDANLGSQHSFIKQASRVLGNLPAPPAFASELPAKDAAIPLNSASQPSSSVHVTAGMVQIRDMTLGGNGTYFSLGKHMDVNFVLSLSPDNYTNSAAVEPIASVLLGKVGSAMSRGWIYLIFIWVLILSISFKIGACFYTGNASR
ncbi:hypothetical protein NMG60_11018692 [Bertholletia excelsa]